MPLQRLHQESPHLQQQQQQQQQEGEGNSMCCFLVLSQATAALISFYEDGVMPMLHALQRELLQQEVLNMQQTVDKGSVAADALSRFAALTDKYKAALLQAAALAELLQLSPPDAAELERKAAATIQGGSLVIGITRLRGPPAASAAATGDEDPAWRDKEERSARRLHLLLLLLLLRVCSPCWG